MRNGNKIDAEDLKELLLERTRYAFTMYLPARVVEDHDLRLLTLAEWENQLEATLKIDILEQRFKKITISHPATWFDHLKATIKKEGPTWLSKLIGDTWETVETTIDPRVAYPNFMPGNPELGPPVFRYGIQSRSPVADVQQES